MRRRKNLAGEIPEGHATKLLMRSSRWLPLARRTVTALAVAGVIACTSPTLPLPPPSLPTVSAGSEPNTFRLKSDKGALPNALIIVVNRNPSLSRDERVEGTLADEQGSWDLEIVGRTGDVVDVSQEHGDTQSGTTSVTLK